MPAHPNTVEAWHSVGRHHPGMRINHSSGASQDIRNTGRHPNGEEFSERAQGDLGAPVTETLARRLSR